jgi:hypothetical protein
VTSCVLEGGGDRIYWASSVGHLEPGDGIQPHAGRAVGWVAVTHRAELPMVAALWESSYGRSSPPRPKAKRYLALMFILHRRHRSHRQSVLELSRCFSCASPISWPRLIRKYSSTRHVRAWWN